MMKVFAYRKCSTCMKALKWLEVHNVEFEERAIKEENPDEPERQIKRNDRRRPVKTPGNRRNARKTPISNRR